MPRCESLWIETLQISQRFNVGARGIGHPLIVPRGVEQSGVSTGLAHDQNRREISPLYRLTAFECLNSPAILRVDLDAGLHQKLHQIRFRNTRKLLVEPNGIEPMTS